MAPALLQLRCGLPRLHPPALTSVSTPSEGAAGGPTSAAGRSRAHTLLGEGRDHDRLGRLREAHQRYGAAIEAAHASGERDVRAEALRRLAVVRHRQRATAAARELCTESYECACALGDELLAAEALNALGGFSLEEGALEAAQQTFRRALAGLAGLGPRSAALGRSATLCRRLELCGRLEQNLGIIANIQGALAEARGHYQRSLEAFRAAGDERGCAIAQHNLGMLSADGEQWAEAAQYYQASLATAEALGDVQLQGLCLLNRTEVLVARQCYPEARRDAEAALAIFAELGATAQTAGAYRALGVIERASGGPEQAEARLQRAIELAVEAASALNEAEATRELARLYQAQGRTTEALRFFHTAHRLYGRVGA